MVRRQVREREGVVPRCEAAVLRLQRAAEGADPVRRALAIGALAGLIACGSAQQRSASPASMSQPRELVAPGGGTGSPDMANDPRGQIEKLSKQIEDESGTLGLSPPPPIEAAGPAERMATIPLSTDATCKPAKNDKCDSSCKLSDSICTNASKICDLALQLDDAWSANKCANAKKSCDAAHETCCSCQ